MCKDLYIAIISDMVHKKFKKGYTTGSCAQAAAKAAAIMLLTQKKIVNIDIKTPSKIILNLNIFDQEIKRSHAKCSVIKDSGDDPDVTNKIKIFAKVRLSQKKGIFITGRQGIGKATKKGLPIAVGEYAINPIPRKMITQEMLFILDKWKKNDNLQLTKKVQGFIIELSVPQGEEIAKRTFNPKLGIIGGISIIGTTGIVEPKSQEAYKASLALELKVLKAQGHRKAILVLGYVGEKYYENNSQLHKIPMIKIGDHVGFMLKECVKNRIKSVLIIGYIGKLIKIANGQFDTNIKYGDNRIEAISRYAKECGAGKEIVDELKKQTTAEAAVQILKQNNLTMVFDKISRDVVFKTKKFVRNKINIEFILLSLEGDILAENNYLRSSLSY